MKRKLPSASHCFVCGIENPFGLKMAFYIDEADRVVCNYRVPAHFQGYPGVVHGGIVASMLDETLARAVMSSNPDRFMFTARLTTRYRAPVPVETEITLLGEVRKDRGRIADCVAFLFGPDGETLAEAEGLLVAVSQEIHDRTNFDGMTWQVYPDEVEEDEK